MKNVIKKQYAILIIGALIIGDMWSINKRYLSEDNNNYVSKNQFVIPQTTADTEILTNNTEKSRVFETRMELLIILEHLFFIILSADIVLQN